MKSFKKIILIILLVLPFIGMSQSITLSSQDDVDAFIATSIIGNLTIKETTADNITNLTALRSLTSMSGGLTIESNAVLASLSGLENLNRVGGDLTIETLYPNGGLALDVIKDEPTYILDYTNDNPELLPIIEEFVRDANANEHNLNVEDIYGVIASGAEIRAELKPNLGPLVFGLAAVSCSSFFKENKVPPINFAYVREFWVQSTNFNKKRIIYHELGHSVFNYKHTTGANDIMTPANWVKTSELPNAIHRLFSGENQIVWNACTGVEEPVGLISPQNLNTESHIKENAFSIAVHNDRLEITQEDNKALKINRVQIINLLGQIVKTSKGNSVALSNLPAGVYIVSIATKNGRFYKKLVRE